MLNYQKFIVLCVFALLSQVAITQPSGSELKRNPDAVILRNSANINSTNLEFSPAFYQNGIVFASSRVHGKKDKKNEVNTMREQEIQEEVTDDKTNEYRRKT